MYTTSTLSPNRLVTLPPGLYKARQEPLPLSYTSSCKHTDEDMTLMHTTMIGAWNGVEEVQQGFPSQEGGPRLIRFESPRWRLKAIQVRSESRSSAQ
jgi:hypothetical protein